MKKGKKIILIVLLLLASNALTFYFTANVVLGGDADGFKLAKIKALEEYVKLNYLYEVKDEDFLIGELKGVVASLNDPYSEYLTEDEMKDLIESTSGKFFGVGIVMTPDENLGLIDVVQVLPGSPAEGAGVKVGDKIMKVDGKDFSSKNFSEASKYIKGKKGSKVTITFLRLSENNKVVDIDITRDEIKLESVESTTIDNLGYIKIHSFDTDTGKDFKKQLKDLESKKVKGLILDLRGNPGGMMDSSVDIADQLLPEGKIVYTKDRSGKVVHEYLSDKEMTKLPLVVLVNGNSASASEVLTGALMDYNRATVVGEKTYGKGIVQNLNEFPTGDGIKLTVSEYFTPKGNSIHKKGIEPDEVVHLPEDVKETGVEFKDTDTQLQKAIEILNKK